MSLVETSIHPSILKPAVKCGSRNKEGAGIWLRTSALRSASADSTVDSFEERAEWIIHTWSPLRCPVFFLALLPHHPQQQGEEAKYPAAVLPPNQHLRKGEASFIKVWLKKRTGYPGERRGLSPGSKLPCPHPLAKVSFLSIFNFFPFLCALSPKGNQKADIPHFRKSESIPYSPFLLFFIPSSLSHTHLTLCLAARRLGYT